ncbi:MAG: hypothetical protein A2Y03_03280 [Omnitrophica WOR_2 bacterium GWF2_38_59]|nr:MAG: hypothetical protein A2Y03_03280 [Omnitrophica WOR_2 bacterium GWF2_38_59]OGX49321.1 MAG: hypothetical protein A2243_08915 [Omnitrophica WOR_2 bacterium RIFOXYA2_FULL_38_17]OGX51489.1 MAG: hypothetical protein A2267_08755 [Omnitrophica WOR_2 bacterium RIFOXYA12_FULL_38_10]HBG61857.1 hypothetical protein [Candidatus Omnitrophota bacterium]
MPYRSKMYSKLIYKTIVFCSLLILSLPSKCFGIYLDVPENKDSKVNPSNQSNETKPAIKTIKRLNDSELITCTIDKFGIKFSCDPHWTIQDIDNNIFVTISNTPSVILTFAKIDSKITFAHQISFEFLEQRNLYADGFKMEDVKFANKNAIKVKAFSKTEPDMRRSDYFLIDGSALYGILFSVYPKESWDDFKFVLKTVEDSIVFTETIPSEDRKE